MVATLAAVASCQQSEVDSIPMPALGGVTLVAQTAEQTRISLSDNTLQQAIQVTWSADDSFSLYDSAGAYVCRFDYSGEDGASQGEFTTVNNIILSKGSTYTALYPYLEGDESLSLAERQAQTTLATQTQSQNSDISHLNDALRMSTEFTYSDSGVITFAHDLSILKISFALSDGATPTELTFADGDISYTLNYSAEITTSDSYTAYTSYMAILPSPTNSGERNLSFSLTTSAGGDPLTHSYPTTSDLVAGHCYTASIQAFSVAVRALADFSAESYPTDSDVWQITDTTAELDTFYGLRDALYAAYDEGREISLIFPNLTEIPASSSSSGAPFYECYALISVEIPEVTSVGKWAFDNCSSLTSIELPLATSIDSYAFIGCSSLSSIELPKAISIGSSVFTDCNSLISIDIPSTVTYIGSGAFSCCDNLTTLNMATSSYIYEGGVIYNSDKSSIVSALKAVVSGDLYSASVTTVEDSAFWGCISLVSIELPKVTSVGSLAFYNCTSLSSIDLPEVTMIEDCAFTRCSSLCSIELPKVTSIDMMAFSYCSSLTEIGLATYYGVQLSFIGNTFSAFHGLTTEDITLTISSTNSEFVSGNTLTVGDISETFKKIAYSPTPM